MVLRYDSYLEVQKQKDDKLANIEQEVKSMKSLLQPILSIIDSLPDANKSEFVSAMIMKGLYSQSK